MSVNGEDLKAITHMEREEYRVKGRGKGEGGTMWINVGVVPGWSVKRETLPGS